MPAQAWPEPASFNESIFPSCSRLIHPTEMSGGGNWSPREAYVRTQRQNDRPVMRALHQKHSMRGGAAEATSSTSGRLRGTAWAIEEGAGILA